MNVRQFIGLSFWLGFLIPAKLAIAISWNTINDPLGTNGTVPLGIDGNSIVGYYVDSVGVSHGFLNDGAIWRTLDAPLGSAGTVAQGVEGSNVVGYYIDTNGLRHGFLYDGTIWKTLDNPAAGNQAAAQGTYPHGISGSRIIGHYLDSRYNFHGFSYDGSSWAEIGGIPTAISGDNVLGEYFDSSSYHGLGFLSDGTNLQTIDPPDAFHNSFDLSVFSGTSANGLSNGKIVGSYKTSDGVTVFSNGFMYDGSSYLQLDSPSESHASSLYGGFSGTFAQSISGDRIVGYYTDDFGVWNGFVAIVPEPSSLTLGASALLLFFVSARIPILASHRSA